MIPYNEAFHKTRTGPTLTADYQEAHRVVGDDAEWVVWPARIERDVCDVGLTYEQSLIKHRAEWRAALGLGSPVTPVTANIIRRGQFFGLSTGAYWTAIECSDFNLLNRFERGEDIRPVLQQRADCGFNLLRVWTLYDIPGIGSKPTCDFANVRIPHFVSLCAQYGLYVEFTAYTGINDPAHWSRLCFAALQCTPYPLLELVNELDQNTNEPDADGRVFHLADYGPAPAPLLSSHGSNGSEHGPVTPFWSYATFHTNGAFEEQRKVGHNAMELWNGPTLTNETSRCPEVGMWTTGPAVVRSFDAAAGAALLCAGSCFHSVRGKISELWDENELEAAEAWAAGARSVPLEFQDGAYRHAAELEGADDLRVYQRVLPDGRAATVRIRK
jgi:hypothetical protein